MNIAPNLFGNTAQKETPAAPQAAAASKGMDKMFMTLLVAQIKNQLTAATSLSGDALLGPASGNIISGMQEMSPLPGSWSI